MKILDMQHFKHCKFILSLLGQSPFQPPLQIKCIRSFITLMIMSILIPKIIKAIESIHDVDIIFEAIPNIAVHLASLCKYFFWTINFNKMKKLMSIIEKNGNKLQLDSDIAIMEMYIKRVRLITSFYTVFVIFGCITYLSSPAVPKILDIIYPLNTSRNRIYLFYTEYFVDPDEYYVSILIHAYCTMPISLAIIVSYDNLLATYIHYVCGMFTILRSYLATLHTSIDNKITVKDKQNTRDTLITCIEIHKDAIEFANNVESCSTFMLLITTFLNLFIITTTGIVTIMKRDQFNEALKFALFYVGTIFHLYYPSYHGEMLIEQSELVINAVYSCEWYRLPLNIQQLLLPLMIRSMTPCQITAGKMITMSMNSFSAVMRNSMSFFTVFSSLQ